MKLAPRKKVALELLHQRLGNISTRLFMAGDNANVWEDIELRLKYYADIKYATLSDLLKQDIIKNENKLISFYDSS